MLRNGLIKVLSFAESKITCHSPYLNAIPSEALNAWVGSSGLGVEYNSLGAEQNGLGVWSLGLNTIRLALNAKRWTLDAWR